MQRKDSVTYDLVAVIIVCGLRCHKLRSMPRMWPRQPSCQQHFWAKERSFSISASQRQARIFCFWKIYLWHQCLGILSAELIIWHSYRCIVIDVSRPQCRPWAPLPAINDSFLSIGFLESVSFNALNERQLTRLDKFFPEVHLVFLSWISFIRSITARKRVLTLGKSRV